jgi:hypothetical protein
MKTHTSYTIQKITILTLIMVGYLFGGSTFADYCTQEELDNLEPACDGVC